jgi:5-methylthioadenosine/S-adenosylhomocysteine deaminase
LLEEVRLAALLQQLSHGPASMSGLEALRLATSEGAEAIGLGSETGSLEVGKAADLLVLSSDRPELLAAPCTDPHDLVAFGASRASVRHVVVGGEILVEDGRLTRLNLEEIRREASRCLEALLQRARF